MAEVGAEGENSVVRMHNDPLSIPGPTQAAKQAAGQSGRAEAWEYGNGLWKQGVCVLPTPLLGVAEGEVVQLMCYHNDDDVWFRVEKQQQKQQQQAAATGSGAGQSTAMMPMPRASCLLKRAWDSTRLWMLNHEKRNAALLRAVRHVLNRTASAGASAGAGT